MGKKTKQKLTNSPHNKYEDKLELLNSLKSGDANLGLSSSLKYFEAASLIAGDAVLLAISDNDLFATKELLKEFNFNANTLIRNTDAENNFLLSKAVKYGNPEIVKHLLDQGANIFEEHRGITPFHFLMETMVIESNLVNFQKYWNIMNFFEQKVFELDDTNHTTFYSQKFHQEKEAFRLRRIQLRRKTLI